VENGKLRVELFFSTNILTSIYSMLYNKITAKYVVLYLSHRELIQIIFTILTLLVDTLPFPLGIDTSF